MKHVHDLGLVKQELDLRAMSEACARGGPEE